MDFIAFDTEDNSADLMKANKSGFLKRVTQIAAIDTRGGSYYSKGDVPGFLKWLRKNPIQRIYAHNCMYDLGSLFGKGALDEFLPTMVGGRMISARWKNKVFCDSMNLWPMALKKVGDALGVKKLSLDVNSKRYVERDVEIVFRAVSFTNKFAARYIDEALPYTLGSLAVKVWKSLGGENWHDESDWNRQALYGGRVELFKEGGKGNIPYCDINSLYPSCMTQKYPVTCLAQKDIDCYGVAHVRLKQPKTWLAPLPVHDDEKGIYYPTGELEGIWTCAEIRNAVKHGAAILKVYDVLGSREGHEYYADYVREIYKLRTDAKDEATRLMYKLLLNNLYGQLGMTGKIGMTVPIESARANEGVCYGSRSFVEMTLPLRDWVNYLHAAHVTSYGRIKLFEHLHAIGREHLIYCDTDSCIFFWPQEKNYPFKVSGELGEMREEGVASECECIAPKAYRWGKKSKAKGIRQPHTDRYLAGKEVEFALPFKYRESIRFYDKGDTKRLSIWRKVTRIRRNDYDKKIWQNGEWLPKHVKMKYLE